MKITARLSACCSLVVSIAAGAALASTACGGDLETYWLAPRDGAFADPTRWSAGVPDSNVIAIFGGTAGGPFVVTIDGQRVIQEINVASQSFTLDGGNPVATTLSLVALVIGGENSTAALTLKGCTVLAAFVYLGWSSGTQSLALADDVVLHADSFQIGDPQSTLNLAPHATLSTDAFTCTNVRWTIDGSNACLVHSDFAWVGTAHIAFGPDGRLPAGSVVPLLSGLFTECNWPPTTILVEDDGRGPNMPLSTSKATRSSTASSQHRFSSRCRLRRTCERVSSRRSH